MRRVPAVAIVLALCAAAPAGAGAQESRDTQGRQTELWEQFPLDPSPSAPPSGDAGGEPRPAGATVPQRDGGGSSTPWIVAGVLGAAGIAMTIAGLAAARRAAHEPDPEPPPPALPPRRGREDGATAPRPAAREATGAPRARRGAGTADPRPTPVPVDLTDRAEWEECRVTLSVEGEDHHFYAAPVGAGDPVARSPVFRARRAGAVMETASGREALQVLVTYLLEGGWQLVGREGEAWALRFRRRVRAPRPVEGHPARR